MNTQRINKEHENLMAACGLPSYQQLLDINADLLAALQYFKRHIGGDASCDLQTLLHMTDAAIAKATQP